MSSSSAFVAGFGRWIETVDLDHRSAIPEAFVAKHRNEVTPSSIGYGPCQFSVLHHVSDTQIFDTYHLVLADDLRRNFVQIVLPSMAHGRMSAGDFHIRLRSVFRSFLFLCGTALQPNQFFKPLTKVTRIINLLTSRESGQVGNTEINTNRLAARRWGSVCSRFTSNIPTAIRFANNGYGTRQFFQGARPNNVQRFRHLRQPKKSISIFKCSFCELRRLASVLATKARIARRFLKKSFIRRFKMSERLLQRNTGYLLQPRKFRLGLQFCQHRVSLNIAAILFSFCPSLFTHFTGAVIDEASTAKRLRKQFSLLLGRIETITITTMEKHNIYSCTTT